MALVIATQFTSHPDLLVSSWVEILSVTVLVSLGVAAFKHFNCHVNSPRFCWRFGHPVEGTHYRACGKHHPKRPRRITADHIAQAHAASSPPALSSSRSEA
jgi:hypothetical protein